MIFGQHEKMQIVTAPATLVNDAAVTTTAIDTKGYDYAQIYVILGANDATFSTLAVQESDASGSGYANITGAVFGTSTNSAGDTSAVPDGDDDNTIFCVDIDLRGRKRYLDVSATVGAGSSGAYVTILAVLSRAEETPNTASERGASQLLRVPAYS